MLYPNLNRRPMNPCDKNTFVPKETDVFLDPNCGQVTCSLFETHMADLQTVLKYALARMLIKKFKLGHRGGPVEFICALRNHFFVLHRQACLPLNLRGNLTTALSITPAVLH